MAMDDPLRVPPEICEDPDLKWSTKAVFARVLELMRTGTGDHCTPLSGTIADELGFCKRTVGRALQELEEEGYIRLEYVGRRTGGRTRKIYLEDPYRVRALPF